jgi:hypothetical protein
MMADFRWDEIFIILQCLVAFDPPISACGWDARATFLTQQRLGEAAEDGGTGYLDALLHLRPCGLF